ncbi:MAG: rod shape-determining protein MreC [Candidatus Omnitrophica bacterium]|nr:rod shape-determining protein MreC [Candidatus Omnitrophota bacterium]
MLWRYRKEILLLFFLLLASLIGIKSSNSCKILRMKESLILPPQEELLSHKRIELERVFIDELLAENRRLREILQLKERSPYSFRRVSKIVRMEPVGWPTTVLIDSGKVELIREGMTVLDKNGSLVGRVIRVDGNTSLVMTLLHPESRISGLIQRTRELGILLGGHPGILELKYLPKESEIKRGDVMLTSGLSTLYPKGLPIGKVLRLRGVNSSLFLDVTVNPAVSFPKLEEVLIIQ